MGRPEKIVLLCFLGCVTFCLCIAIACGVVFTTSKIIPEFAGKLTNLHLNPESTEATAIIPTQTSTATNQSDAAAEMTLNSLENTVIPEANWVQLSEEFNHLSNIPTAVTTPPVAYKIGDESSFWVLNDDTKETIQVKATLQYKTNQIYFWIENGVNFDAQQFKKAADTFANKIYPTDQEFFGKEWIPGVDNDPHLYILYTRGLGNDIAGYTSDSDSVLDEAHSYSNEHEMFYINADIQTFTDPYTLSVMAHEFQHLIHGYHDPNEELWLNEGFSELASFINGYDTGGFDELFAENPDVNLTVWPNDPDATNVHYGSSFLFTTYLLDRFGEKTTKAVVADLKNGLDSIDDVFKNENLIDSTTNQVLTSVQFFQDWTLANYLNDTKIGDGRYGYTNYKNLPDFSGAQENEDCSSSEIKGDVNQFGTDYIHFACDGNYSLKFTGDATVNILSVSPKEGSYYLWSNMADSSDTRMTREFDFSQLSGKIDLSYDMWYDLEKDYDFVYLLASTDNQTWQNVDTPSCTTDDTTGNNYGCAYNGITQGWVHQEVDLSQFAGKKVTLRFEYVTDAGVTGEGFVIDNLEIPQLNYQTGFESDDGGWQLEGFARIENQIPQTFLVSVIHGSGDDAKIEKYEAAPGRTLTFNIDSSQGDADLTIVVSGSERYTRQPAKYQLNVSANP